MIFCDCYYCAERRALSPVRRTPGRWRRNPDDLEKLEKMARAIELYKIHKSSRTVADILGIGKTIVDNWVGHLISEKKEEEEALRQKARDLFEIHKDIRKVAEILQVRPDNVARYVRQLSQQMKEERKVLAWSLYQEYEDTKKVADILEVDTKTIYNWIGPLIQKKKDEDRESLRLEVISLYKKHRSATRVTRLLQARGAKISPITILKWVRHLIEKKYKKFAHRDEARKFYQEGLTNYAEIARRVGAAPATVKRWVKDLIPDIDPRIVEARRLYQEETRNIKKIAKRVRAADSSVKKWIADLIPKKRYLRRRNPEYNHVQQRMLDLIREEGRQARKDYRSRTSPYTTPEFIQAWLGGWDEIKAIHKLEKKERRKRKRKKRRSGSRRNPDDDDPLDIPEELTPESLEAWSDAVKEHLDLWIFHLSIFRNGDICLHSIIVKPDDLKQGKGTEAMKRLTDLADYHQRRIWLTPGEKSSHTKTTSRRRLVKFYKRFDFVLNKGRNKDYRCNEAMYRRPQPGQLQRRNPDLETLEKIAEARKLYRNKVSLSEIVRRLRSDFRTIKGWVKGITPIDDPRRAEARKLYQEGVGLKKIAKQLQAGLSNIKRWVGDLIPDKPDVDPRRAEARKLYQDGVSIKKISRQLRTYHARAQEWVKDLIPDRRAVARQLYLEGLRIAEIRRHLKTLPGGEKPAFPTIQKWIEDLEPPEDPRIQQARELYQDGIKTYKIRDILGVSHSVLKRWLEP